VNGPKRCPQCRTALEKLDGAKIGEPAGVLHWHCPVCRWRKEWNIRHPPAWFRKRREMMP
jgi:hypothetical protein